MAPSDAAAAGLAPFEAEFDYLVKTGERPVTFVTPAGELKARDATGTYEPRTARVNDARPLAASLDLDVEGFALADHVSAVQDFFDEAETAKTYIPELEEIVKAATGAKRVVVFDRTLRSESEARRIEKQVRGPVRHVHNDYTERSGPQRVLTRRFAIVNVWRPIGVPADRKPLAILDADSIAPEDLVATERRAKDRIGEVQHVTYNPDHRWFWFPHQTPDEVVLIKCFDSETDGRARFTAHTAIDDPNVAADAPPRASIEARTFAFF
jgi:hypothetical protein